MTDDAELPVAVIARTDPVRGVPVYADKAPLLHTLRFTDDADRARFEAAYQELKEAR